MHLRRRPWLHREARDPEGVSTPYGNSVCKGLRKLVLPAVKQQLAGTRYFPVLPVF